jgi:Heterokaryon incompatibility protein (HET)
MRLLQIDSHGELSFTKDRDSDIPSYAILSHTWGGDEDEVTFSDLGPRIYKSKKGYRKIRFCGEQARKDKIEYFWVDTCCIDKANHTEYSEAINSMYRWYRNAQRCYVYLYDVSIRTNDGGSTERTWESGFRESRWFKRGWTLQELIAPSSVEFFSQKGERLGSKETLEQLIHEITEIPIPALRGTPPSRFSVDERMRWARKRETKKKEDKAYCLLGVFDLFMPLIYGEGDNAFTRLEEEIHKPSTSKRSEQREKTLRWLAPMDFEQDIDVFSSLWMPGTSQWILQDPEYLKWRTSTNPTDTPRFLWLAGGVGCGKTFLAHFCTENLVNDNALVIWYFFNAK